MEYLILFLDGIITFISPCLLPMLPIYISYFAGQNNTVNTKKVLFNAIGFIFGFTLVFMLLGAFSGTIGGLLKEYEIAFNLVSGVIVLLFGLHFLELIKIPILNRNRQFELKKMDLGFFSSVLFGIIFSVSWTPCVSAFLGSALMMAAQSGESVKGILLLLCYSLGLGVPLLFTALLINRLKSTFDFIKANYHKINLFSGVFLILIGILMATGLLGYFLSLLTF